jgi:hypothetical protein
MSNSTSKWFKYLTEAKVLCEECGGMHEGACPMSDAPHSMDRELHHDDEGRMAKSQLYKIAKYAMEIHDNLGDDDQLEGWVQSKIATMSSMMGAVKHYLEYEYKRGTHSVMEEDND